MLNRAAIFLSLLLLSSCYKQPAKSVKLSEELPPVEGVMVAEREYSDSHNDRPKEKRKSWSRLVESIEGDETLRKINSVVGDGQIMVSTKEFTAPETQYVSNKAHDPFGGGEYFILPLSEMDDDFCYPIKGKFLSNYGMRNGRMHTGVDIKAALRDTIRAAFNGVVRLSKPYSGYGNVIVIRHFNGIETVYSHNSKNLVKVQQVVRRGDPIALAGRTGRATTEHLHFEVRISGQAVNPNLFIDVHNHTLKDDDLYISKSGTAVKVSTTIPRTADKYTLAKESSIDPDAVKVVKAASIKETSKTTAAAKKPASVPSNYKGKVHTVKSGDTLSAIARRYGTTVTKLCNANGLTSRSVLRIGQKIKIK